MTIRHRLALAWSLYRLRRRVWRRSRLWSAVRAVGEVVG